MSNLKELIKNHALSNKFIPHRTTSVPKVFLKEFTFELDKKSFEAVRYLMLQYVSYANNSLEYHERRLKQSPMELFEEWFKDGNEQMLIDLMVQQGFSYFNTYYYNYSKSKYFIDFSKRRLEDLKYLKNDTTEIIISDSDLYNNDNELRSLHNKLVDVYQNIILTDNKLHERLKDSIDKLDKVSKYKKGLINCRIISI